MNVQQGNVKYLKFKTFGGVVEKVEVKVWRISVGSKGGGCESGTERGRREVCNGYGIWRYGRTWKQGVCNEVEVNVLEKKERERFRNICRSRSLYIVSLVMRVGLTSVDWTGSYDNGSVWGGTTRCEKDDVDTKIGALGSSARNARSVFEHSKWLTLEEAVGLIGMWFRSTVLMITGACVIWEEVMQIVDALDRRVGHIKLAMRT